MRYFVLSFLCGAALIAYVQRSAISVPADLIQRELNIDTRSMGLIMGCWYWAYAAFQVPSGWLADRWGARRALTVFAIAASVLTGVASLSGEFSELLLTWSLMGVAQAGFFPCATKAIGQWFGETQRAFASSLLGCGMAMGAALAPMLTGQLLVRFSWQQVFWLYAIPGTVLAALYFLLTPALPRTTIVPPVPQSAAAVWRRLFSSTSMALLCLQQFLRAAAMVFFSTWFPRFLQEVYGVSRLDAGRLTAWPCLAAVGGGLLGGYVSDRILVRTGNRRLSRQGVAVAGMSGCALLFLTAFFVEHVHLAVLLMSLGAFSAAFGGVSGYVVAIEFGGTRVATVFSVMNMCGSIGSGLFPIAVAWIVEKHHHWDLALLLFAGIFAVDAVCWALLNPRAPLFERCAPSD